VTLANDGTAAVTGISATLETSTPGVTVTRAAASFPDIAPHAAAQSNAPHFAFTVDASVLCGDSIDFTLRATASQGSWIRTFTMLVGRDATTTTKYDSSDVPKVIDDLTTMTSSLTVPAGGDVSDLDVGLSLTHTYDGDLIVVLVDPTGRRSLLTYSDGGSGQGFTGTMFDDEASSSIESGTAPFAGSFKPRQPLSGYDGSQASGTWTLEIQDIGNGDTGTLTSWSLTPTVTTGYACSACGMAPPGLAPVTITWSPGGKSSLTWDSVPGATFYNTYRGSPSGLPLLLNGAVESCLRTTSVATTTGSVLGEIPPSNSFYWYLVRAANGAGQGPAGNATAGPRSQESTGSCP
jgi:subtilisin-like proprotein convertase family protein